MLVSLERNMRGFFYTREFHKSEDFLTAMKFNIENDNNEIEWAKLFDEFGEPMSTYNRGDL